MDSILRPDMKSNHQHIPVMLNEVVESLQPKSGAIYVDGTFGAGGYSRAILENADCTVYAIDRDPDAYNRAKKMAEEFTGRLIPIKGCFGSVKELLSSLDVKKVDGIVLDIGVSSVQIDSADRGFSFQADGPLDMRMSKQGMSAADVVNNLSEKELADIIYKYGEERASRRIAKRIVEERVKVPITTTLELAEIIHKVLPRNFKTKKDTATKTFQALRIYVNNELEELEKVLEDAEQLLSSKGRLVVVSFHSLEDGIVKRFLKTHSGLSPKGSRHMPHIPDERDPSFKLEGKGIIKPSNDEVKVNPRARSARLRYGLRTKNLAWSGELNA